MPRHPKKPTKAFGIRLPVEQAQALEAIAAQSKKDRNAVVREAIALFLRQDGIKAKTRAA